MSTGGELPILWAITIQDPTNRVDNMMSINSSININPSSMTYQSGMNSQVKGAWSVAIMVFRADGQTPLDVAYKTVII